MATGDEGFREQAGGWVPRHAESYATSGALGSNQATVWKGQNARAFRVGVAGDVTVTDESGSDVTFYSVQVGEVVVQAFSAIKSATTTAQKITVQWA